MSRWTDADLLKLKAKPRLISPSGMEGRKTSGKRGQGLELAPSGQARPAGPAPARSAQSRVILSEAQVLKTCLSLLLAHPKVALAWRANTGGLTGKHGQYVRFGFKGQPDLMAVLKGGKYLAVECKATGKTADRYVSAEQRRFLENVIQAGAHALCVDDPWILQYFLDDL